MSSPDVQLTKSDKFSIAAALLVLDLAVHPPRCLCWRSIRRDARRARFAAVGGGLLFRYGCPPGRAAPQSHPAAVPARRRTNHPDRGRGTV